MKTKYKIALLCVHIFIVVSLPTLTFLHYLDNDLSWIDVLNVCFTPLYLLLAVIIIKQLIEERKRKV